jgi:hypothetical protein
VIGALRQAIVLIIYFQTSLFVPSVAAGAAASGSYLLRDSSSAIESNQEELRFHAGKIAVAQQA